MDGASLAMMRSKAIPPHLPPFPAKHQYDYKETQVKKGKQAGKLALETSLAGLQNLSKKDQIHGKGSINKFPN